MVLPRLFSWNDLVKAQDTCFFILAWDADIITDKIEDLITELDNMQFFICCKIFDEFSPNPAEVVNIVVRFVIEDAEARGMVGFRKKLLNVLTVEKFDCSSIRLRGAPDFFEI